MEEQLHKKYLQRAIDWAQKGKETKGGGPFGAVIVKDTTIIAEGHNRVGATSGNYIYWRCQ